MESEASLLRVEFDEAGFGWSRWLRLFFLGCFRFATGFIVVGVRSGMALVLRMQNILRIFGRRIGRGSFWRFLVCIFRFSGFVASDLRFGGRLRGLRRE